MRYGSIYCDVLLVDCLGDMDGRRKHLSKCDFLSCRSFQVSYFGFGGKDGLLVGTTPWEGFKVFDYWICIVGFGMLSSKYSGVEITWMCFRIRYNRAITGIVESLVGY